MRCDSARSILYSLVSHLLGDWEFSIPTIILKNCCKHANNKRRCIHAWVCISETYHVPLQVLLTLSFLSQPLLGSPAVCGLWLIYRHKLRVPCLRWTLHTPLELPCCCWNIRCLISPLSVHSCANQKRNGVKPYNANFWAVRSRTQWIVCFILLFLSSP